MRKTLFELVLFVVICGILGAIITVSYATEKPFLVYIRTTSTVDAIFIMAIAMVFASVIAICGYVFGVSRGRGKMLSAEDLIPNKLFRITGMEPLNHSVETLVSIEINGKNKRCSYFSSAPPKDATHIRAILEDSGLYRFEFVKVSPEVIELVP